MVPTDSVGGLAFFFSFFSSSSRHCHQVARRSVMRKRSTSWCYVLSARGDSIAKKKYLVCTLHTVRRLIHKKPHLSGTIHLFY